MMDDTGKPLGGKAYGSIAHLPGSRRGPGDHGCPAGQARIACEAPRDRHDIVVVQEKLDGSCCAVAKVDGQILALGRAGWFARSSPYRQHQLFAAWVRAEQARFDALLKGGERVVGEWLAQAHGTRYALPHEPFVVFDIISASSNNNTGLARAVTAEVEARSHALGFTTPVVLSRGPSCSIDTVMSRLDPIHHGALDPIEGAVWRVERKGAVDFLVKYVRPSKVDGCYLPQITGLEEVWNWQPPQ